MVLASELLVNCSSFLFSSDESEFSNTKCSSYCASFCKYGFDVFVCFQDRFADGFLVRFEFWRNFNDGYVAYDVEGLRQT